MNTRFIGLIVGERTRTVYSVVNPEDDAELDSPHHLELKNVQDEPVRMIKVRRNDYGHMGAMTPEDVFQLVTLWYAKESDVYHGPDIIDGIL